MKLNTINWKQKFLSDWYETFIVICIVFAISLFINPLKGVGISEWDRTFSPALLDGISINKRITHFYLLFLIAFPVLFITVSIGIKSFLFKFPHKKNDLFFISCFLLILTFSAYFNHSSKDFLVVSCLFVFTIFTMFSLFGNEKIVDFSFFTKNILLLITLIVSINIFTNFRKIYPTFGIACFLLILQELVFQIRYKRNKSKSFFQILPFVLMWMPAFCFILLETCYFFIEKGFSLQNYRSYIIYLSILIIFAIIILFKIINIKNNSIKAFGYVGALISLVCVSYFYGNYHFIFDYKDYANLYELGNRTVAADTFFHGKLPIIDYFSAHALSDVWTSLIYSFLHNDFQGILVDPYSGLKNIVAFLALFYIVKNIFSLKINSKNHELDFSIAYIILFPALVTGIKWLSVCIIVISALIYLQKKNTIKSNYIFWLSVIISSLHTYDEGISLSLGCISSVIITAIITNNWNYLKRFITSGIITGLVLLGIYTNYCLVNVLDPISRFKEWLSVSLGSTSSWATSSFGDENSFSFFIAYFLVPITVLVVSSIIIIKFYKTKHNPLLFTLVLAFSITEMFYIPRTIVFHNLMVCRGITGVLMNYIHWTLALFALFLCSEKFVLQRFKNLVFIFIMFITITLEGAFVTNQMPNSFSSLAGKSIESSKEWKIGYHNVENKRIIYEEKTEKLVNKFKFVLNTLLEKNQTFLDFANVTSMYLLTERNRPAYVGQLPSLLTDLYSQEQFLQKISEYDCPVAILGTTSHSYLQQMIGIPHNIRYYKIAEYIYKNYRPIIGFDEIAVWCKKDLFDKYINIIKSSNILANKEFALIDYGYDLSTELKDDRNISGYEHFHSYNLKQLPYIWANNDIYQAVSRAKIAKLKKVVSDKQHFTFEGSKYISSEKGNYLFMKIEAKSNTLTSLKLSDSNNKCTTYEYKFFIKKEVNNYLIRISQDYFWYAYNIDTFNFTNTSDIKISDIQILSGD